MATQAGIKVAFGVDKGCPFTLDMLEDFARTMRKAGASGREEIGAAITWRGKLHALVSTVPALVVPDTLEGISDVP